jgi:LysR family hydrogen peroxide-inducible transcriptional activator
MTAPLPSLRQLRYLVAVADHGHFGRAAEASLVTQSTLSASIKELEAILGRTLIERTKRTVIVTPLGRDIAARARAVLSDVADLSDAVKAAGPPLSGTLRLGVIPTIGPYLLPRAWPALRAAHPALELFLREDQTAPLLARLGAGDLDAVLMAFPYPAAAFETALFADDPFWLAFPRGHALASRERIDPGDLTGDELLLLEEGHCLRDHALALCDVPGPDRFQATSLHTLAQMVDNGLGLTLLPKMAIDGGLIRGTRVEIRPMNGPARHIGLAWRKTSSRRADFTHLAAHFRDELATPLPPSG